LLEQREIEPCATSYLDFKISSNLVVGLSTPVLIFLTRTRPFGVERDLADRHPWESIQKYMMNFTFSELYMGFAYIAAGERPEAGC